ncbi:hypothetical protein GWE18_23045 [Bradyrhizobium sp. CSA112]|uniref:hypothetical protein n=1 Tax=Bradyrhizobium sp. CSA112 TaxID=2699170 RepID=UPI0023B07F04|nr:hypothetical protein [Bradyrhizobium sp. CSA112]MDE5455663.1 hypothetical protein [Bradyrhizobium sp. CSA112]
MTKANAAKALPAAMVTPFVVTAASVPSVMMTASAVPTSMTAPAPMLDLYHSAIRRGHRGNAQPGGSGYGHGQRSKQRSSNQNETSHLVLSPSRDRDEAQVPEEWVCSPGVKLNPQCDIRAIPGLAFSGQKLGKSGNMLRGRFAGEPNG